MHLCLLELEPETRLINMINISPVPKIPLNYTWNRRAYRSGLEQLAWRWPLAVVLQEIR